MAKPKGINQKARWRAHAIRLARYADRVQSVYDTLNKEIAKSVVRTSYDGSVPFRFADYPLAKKKFEEVQSAFVRDLRAVIYGGTNAEWNESNLVQDLLADKVLKFYGSKAGGKKHRVYYQANSDVLKAFQERKDKGLNLSQKLWNQTKEYKTEMEYAISSAIEKGTSAVTLSKRLSKYLVDFPSLKHDYKEKFGNAFTCQDCEYRSIRLARSEINMAYRKAEQERWKQFDFVLGYEVKTTQNGHHVPDICDDLAGKYPKDFIFLGWHPNCMCYVIPILKTEEEFWEEEDVETVKDVPQGMKEWIANNTDRIADANERSSLPYWYKDNFVRNKSTVMTLDSGANENIGSFLKNNSKEVISLSKEQLANLQSVEDTLKIKRDALQTIQDALEGANADRTDGASEYRYNCQCSVVAYLMRRMGFDVKAVGLDITLKDSIPYKIAFRENQSIMYLNPKNGEKAAIKNTCKNIGEKNPVGEALSQLDEATKERGIYQLAYVRMNRGGHRLVAERLSDGTLQIVCPQTKRVFKDWLDLIAKDNVWYIKGIDVVRIDDKLINTKYIADVVTR